MPLWGKSDAHTNSVSYAVNQFKRTANTSNIQAFYGNTTVGAYMNSKLTAGQFGVDSAEVNVSSGGLAIATLTNAGSGYAANAAVTVSGNGTANTTVALGRVTALTVNSIGSGYTSNPTVAIAAPAAINITANSSGFSNTTDTFVVATANSRFQVGDTVYYAVPAGNTAIAPLSGNVFYYVSFANTTTLALSATPGGANVNIVDTRDAGAGETHTIRGETAAGAISIGGGETKGATAGWNIRTEGTGGRAGRVQYECLVAMRGITSDGSDDTVLPDA
jgi:hypothetical protein